MDECELVGPLERNIQDGTKREMNAGRDLRRELISGNVDTFNVKVDIFLGIFFPELQSPDTCTGDWIFSMTDTNRVLLSLYLPEPAPLSSTRSPDLKVNGAETSLPSNALTIRRCCRFNLGRNGEQVSIYKYQQNLKKRKRKIKGRTEKCISYVPASLPAIGWEYIVTFLLL